MLGPMGAARGFTVVEVLVALIVFAVGILGLAAETASLTRALARSRRAAIVSAAAATRLERLRVVACDAPADGTEPVSRNRTQLARLEWTWGAGVDSTARVRLVTVPSGPTAHPLVRPDTLTATFSCRR
ncbi:MAG: type IV pilus modification PilV family protein [Gemmatimonadales bacterium]